MKFVYDDGGRMAAGFRRANVGDCVVRSISIALELPYSEVRSELLEYAERFERGPYHRSNPSNGVRTYTFRTWLAKRGWIFKPTMQIGSGCRVHLRDGEVPDHGRFILRLSKHVTALVDGEIHDTYDPSRGGTRCVYGYWSKT